MTAEQARKTREAALSSKQLVRIFERINHVAQTGGSLLFVSFQEMPYGGPTLLASEPYLYKVETKVATHYGPDNGDKTYICGYNISW